MKNYTQCLGLEGPPRFLMTALLLLVLAGFYNTSQAESITVPADVATYAPNCDARAGTISAATTPSSYCQGMTSSLSIDIAFAAAAPRNNYVMIVVDSAGVMLTFDLVGAIDTNATVNATIPSSLSAGNFSIYGTSIEDDPDLSTYYPGGPSSIVGTLFSDWIANVENLGGVSGAGDICGDVTTTFVEFTIIASEDASFSYAAAAYCPVEADPTPAVLGVMGGTFTSTPAGLSLDATTGTIDVSTSTAGNYTITYTTGGVCPATPSQSVTIEVGAAPRFVSVDPENNLYTIENCGSCAVDLTGYRLCASYTYRPLNSMHVVAGNLNLAPDATVTVTWDSPDPLGSDLALYLPTGAYGVPEYMVDFTQWGTSGNGRESVAVAKGIWDEGATILGPGAYTRADCSLEKMAAWKTAAIMTSTSGCNDYTVNNVFSNSWVYFKNGAGHIVAAIQPGGNDLGDVMIQVNDMDSVSQDKAGRYYLPRYFNFESSNYTALPSVDFPVPVMVRIYFAAAELDEYNTAQGSAETINELSISHYSGDNEDCNINNNPTENRESEFIVPTASMYNGTEGFYLEVPLNHFSELGVSSSSGGTLPIELLSFEGQALRSKNTLTWTTATEIGFDHFVLERSIDGIDFRALGTVKSNGNNTGSTYNYNDEIPLLGSNYYRLKMVEQNGTSTYSELVILELEREIELVLLPNPVKNMLTLELAQSSSEKSKLRVFNLSGIKMLETTLEANEAEIELNLNHLPTGTYFLRLDNVEGSKSYKFVKI